MKKLVTNPDLIIICLTILLFVLVMSSCSKEEYWTRNWQVPVDLNNPTGIAGGGSIMYELGTPDSVLIQRIIERQNLTDEEIKYLTLTPYAYNGTNNSYEFTNPDPRYMAFPHSICSTQDNWGWEHYEEYCDIGRTEFCNKYFDGQLTLGMTWGFTSCD